MGLIEQLGGYGAAKRIIAATPKGAVFFEVAPIRPRFYMSDIGCNRAIRVSDLERGILEYRRQHNIFEVGDKVVIAGNGSLFEVAIPRSEYSDRYIALAIIFKNLARLKYADWYERDSVRHATDAEIEAGHRI